MGTENGAAIEVHYEDHGSGRPVVLIHGYPLNGNSWERQERELLAGAYRVVSHDRRGCGSARVRKAALLGAIPPFLLKTDDMPAAAAGSPSGLPRLEPLETVRAGVLEVAHHRDPSTPRSGQ